MYRDILIEFVGQMQKEYPSVIFRFEYDEEEESYRIWHTYGKGQEDLAFLSSMGRLIRDIFIPSDFFDYYIDYNAEYAVKFYQPTHWMASSKLTSPASVEWMYPLSYPSTTERTIAKRVTIIKSCDKSNDYCVNSHKANGSLNGTITGLAA